MNNYMVDVAFFFFLSVLTVCITIYKIKKFDKDHPHD